MRTIKKRNHYITCEKCKKKFTISGLKRKGVASKHRFNCGGNLMGTVDGHKIKTVHSLAEECAIVEGMDIAIEKIKIDKISWNKIAKESGISPISLYPRDSNPIIWNMEIILDK